MISQEVWERLDTRSGTLTWRGRAAVFAASAAAIALAVGGLTFPHLEQRPGGDPSPALSQDELGHRTGVAVRAAQVVANEGPFPVTVTGVAVTGAGLSLTGVRTGLPFTIPAGGRVSVALDLAVTDCVAARSGSPSVVLEVAHGWGSVTVRPEVVDPWGFGAEAACR